MTDLTSSESTSEIGPPKVACIYSHQGMTTEVLNINFSWNWIENDTIDDTIDLALGPQKSCVHEASPHYKDASTMNKYNSRKPFLKRAGL